MLDAFARAIAQLFDRSLRRFLWLSLAIALAVFALLWLGLEWGLALLAASTSGWVRTAVDWAARAGALVLAIVLFPAAVTAVQTTLLVDGIAAAVEARHYPRLPAPRVAPFSEQAAAALRFLALAIGLNLAALPLYFVPGINVVAFLALNGYLLARENFDALAARRLEPDAARRLWRGKRARFVLAGCAFALAASVPVVNLAAAIFAAAASVHLVEAWRGQTPA
jgi:uncharacterized protein involved in cysteine biosynthesis